MDFISDVDGSDRTRLCSERLSGDAESDSDVQCRGSTQSYPAAKSGFFHTVRWWCSLTRQRWLEESAFRLLLIMHQPTLLLMLCASAILRIAECCSSRSTPRPRPPTPTQHRPNITFQTYACPEAYAKWYCLNGATCFSVKIDESILYNCECANGYVGQRCEFKDLEGSYLASRQQVMIETASIAGSVALLILILVIVSVAVYVHYKRKRKERLHPKAYQPFGSFREVKTNGVTRPLQTTDPESGQPSHAADTFLSKASVHSASNRSRTVH